ncbi:MAG: hypothetical protein AAGE01_09260 [Pseudomonadota bacterium]
MSRQRTSLLALLLAAGACLTAPAQAETWALDAAAMTWRLDADALAGVGAELAGESNFSADSQAGGTLTLDLNGDAVRKFTGAGLVFTGGPRLRIGDRTVDLGSFLLRAAPERPLDLAVSDLAGNDLLRLRLGHHWIPNGTSTLRSDVMDVRAGPALAAMLRVDGVDSVLLGSVTMAGRLLLDGAEATPKALCSANPAWPDGEDVFVDLLMIPDPQFNPVSERQIALGRDRGVVYMAPTARFRMIGPADTPWYSRFVTPDLDLDCIDDGSGSCEPYGESAGGYLVWSVYRLRDDGVVEQVGLSGIKHAFNSVNEPSSDPDFDCPCPFRSSRVAVSGCEDLYSASTNSDPRFMGPRDELEAFPVAWESCGSVFDLDCDGVCDRVPRNPFLWQCEPVIDDVTDFLPAVDEAVVASADRLFVESWYLVRDDVDLFNSMSTIELDRTFNPSGQSGVWVFEEREFGIGPAISRIAAEGGREPTEVDSGGGRLLVDARAVDLGDGWTRYVYSIMNVDYDPQVSRFSVSLGDQVVVRNPAFIGVAGRSTTGWLLEQNAGEIAWSAPSDETLDWGTMMTFVFEADQPPTTGAIGFDSPGEQGGLSSQAPRPRSGGELILRSGFEASDANR